MAGKGEDRMWQVRERTGAHVAGEGEDRSTCGR